MTCTDLYLEGNIELGSHPSLVLLVYFRFSIVAKEKSQSQQEQFMRKLHILIKKYLKLRGLEEVEMEAERKNSPTFSNGML